MWICPECDEEINHLRYNVNTSGWEGGSADLNDTQSTNPHQIVVDYKCYDSGEEWHGDPNYECPECDNQINLSDLIWKDKDKDEEPELINEPEELEHEIITPQNYITTHRDLSNKTTDVSMICKQCFYVFATENQNGYNSEEFHNCPDCGHLNSSTEFKKLLDNDYFLTHKPCLKES